MATHIVSLTAENLKRLRAVRITPDGSIVQITGRNAQGKSSVLDAIEMALGGKDHICDRPVRDGQQKARVVCELDDLIITRTFTAGGGGTLTVQSKDGARYPSPQSILDSLVGRLTFDPLEFSRMPAKQQAETLRSLVGIDFAAADAKRAKLYEDRTLVNRELKGLQSRLADLPEVEAPDEEVNIAALVRQANDIAAANAVTARLETESMAARRRLGEAKDRLADLEERMRKQQQEIEDLTQQAFDLDSRRAGTKVLDASGIQQQIDQAQKTNRCVAMNRDRTQVVLEINRVEGQATALTEKIDQIDAEKRSALENAKFPIAGLSFDESGVLFNGIPFDQASGAEKLKISVAIGLAMNPKLRVLLIRDGSLLDADNMQVLAAMAKEHDAQIWLERVSDGEQVGVVIEDGEVAQNGPRSSRVESPALSAK